MSETGGQFSGTCKLCGGRCHEQYVVCAFCHKHNQPNEEYERNVLREVRANLFKHASGIINRGPKHLYTDMKRVKIRKADDYTRDVRPEDISGSDYNYHGDNLRDDCY